MRCCSRILLAFVVLALLGVRPAAALPVTAELAVWLRAGDLALADGADVLVWHDRSGNGIDARFDPANVYGEQAPLFDAANPWVGGLPTVRFENENALVLDLGFLAGSDYTVIAVNRHEGSEAANFFLAGDTRAANQNLVLGYERPHRLRQAHFSNDLDAIVASGAGAPPFSIDSFVFSSSEGRQIAHDGEVVASDDNPLPLISNTGTTLGNFRAFGNRYFFHGDLAELAIYTRALTPEERDLVEQDLARRYDLALAAVPEARTGWLLAALAAVGRAVRRRGPA